MAQLLKYAAIVLFLIINQTSGQTPRYECSADGFFSLDCYLHDVHLTSSTKNFQVIPHQDVSKIKEIRFVNSKMEILTNDVCEALPYVSKFFANGLGLIAIEEDAFEKCQKETKLGWNSYSFKRVLADFTSIISGTFMVWLNDNKLKQFDWAIFKNKPNLIELKLENNQLSEFSVSTMPVMKKLQKLYLSDNQLLDIGIEELLLKAPTLQMITLAGNKFECERQKAIMMALNKKNIKFDSMGDCTKINKRLTTESPYTTETTLLATLESKSKNKTTLELKVTNKDEKYYDPNMIIIIIFLSLFLISFVCGSFYYAAKIYIRMYGCRKDAYEPYDYDNGHANDQTRGLSVPVSREDPYYEYITGFNDHARAQAAKVAEVNEIYRQSAFVAPEVEEDEENEN